MKMMQLIEKDIDADKDSEPQTKNSQLFLAFLIKEKWGYNKYRQGHDGRKKCNQASS